MAASTCQYQDQHPSLACPRPPSTWTEVGYTYDPAGRRIEKKYDGTTVVKYLYDGDHCIAEYDGNNNLLRKFIYGPDIDQPACMIDVEHSNATYYYHFDGLGSVAALTNASGTTAVLYEYSVYGQVAASDPNHPNRFMFTGREFDKETGLYYYRARYYNPEIGRFLQTDPIGYGDGMNWYTYCGNDPTGLIDPSGLIRIAFYDGSDPGTPWYNGTAWEFPVNGDVLHEFADDDWFDLSIDISVIPENVKEMANVQTSADYIIYILKCFKEWGADVTDVYIFDHAWEGGITLGNDWYFLDNNDPDKQEGNGSLEEFARELGQVTNDGTYDPETRDYSGCKIHLRGCYAGYSVDKFSQWSNRWVDGCMGPVRRKYYCIGTKYRDNWEPETAKECYQSPVPDEADYWANPMHFACPGAPEPWDDPDYGGR